MFARIAKVKWATQSTRYAIVFFFAAPLLFSPNARSADGPASDSSSEAAIADSRPANPESAPSEAEFQGLKSLVQAQSVELERLTRALKEQQAKTQALQEKFDEEFNANRSSETLAGSAPAAVINAAPTAFSSSPDSPASPNAALLQSSEPVNMVAPEHPLSIKLGAVDFTPGGFLDLTAISRSADVGGGLGTNFTILPYNNSSSLGRLSEFRFTGQGSRLSLKVDAQPGKSTALAAYLETDFNGFEPANSNISSKSDSFRLRLAFVQLRRKKWEVVTGQTWSLLTPTRRGLSPLPENIFTALRLDTSYLAGIVYDRQPGIRVVYHPGSWWTLAVALENPQQFVPGSVVFPTDGASNFFSTQFDNGSSSTSAASSAVNPTVPNLHPDVIAKTAFDWQLGEKLFHIDAGGIVRSFKVLDNLVSPAATRTITGGGGGINANLEVLRNFRLIANSFYGEGVGRYIGGLGPDVIVKPDGSLSAVHAGSGVAGMEWQTRPKFLIDGYYSGAYFWRNYDVTTPALGAACSAGRPAYCVGFGYPGSADSANRDYQEASLGLIPTIFSSPNLGKLQLISQFSWVVRVPWYVAPNNPKNAHTFLSYVSLRYIVP